MTISLADDGAYEFATPIRTVAIVGCGPTGAPAARHLRDQGLEVTVFERQAQSGGVWGWSPVVAPPLAVPTPPPSTGAFFPATPDAPASSTPQSRVVPDKDGKKALYFNPPNPVYWSLTNNVPASTMEFKDWPYPASTPENVTHTQLSTYVRGYVEHYGIDKLTKFNTRVEHAEKVGDKWRLTLHKLEAEEGAVRETFWIDEFDVFIVATGHYNAPFIPEIQGAAAWSAAWPDKLLHSSGYRIPEPYAGKDVVIVGIGTSGIDMARDLAPHVNKVYMVGKNVLSGPESYQAMRRSQRLMMPDNAQLVPEIQEFRTPKGSMEASEIVLTDGTVLSNIGLIIFSTGYQYSYPFLPQYHADGATDKSKSSLLVTDGSGVLNLYRDIFFIPDPTLAFLGLSVNVSAFSCFEYQALAAAHVFAQQARIPDKAALREAYDNMVATKGEGKFSHYLGREGERIYVAETVKWLNDHADKFGGKHIKGHSEAWIAAQQNLPTFLAEKYGLDPAIMAGLAEAKPVPPSS